MISIEDMKDLGAIDRNQSFDSKYYQYEIILEEMDTGGIYVRETIILNRYGLQLVMECSFQSEQEGYKHNIIRKQLGSMTREELKTLIELLRR